MAIKTTGTGQKKVADSAVENSDELWKAAVQPFSEWLQLITGQILAGKRRADKAQPWNWPESGKLGYYRGVLGLA